MISLLCHPNSLDINRRRLLLIIRSKVLSGMSVTMKRATLDSAVLKNTARDRSSGARATTVSECDEKGRNVSRVITNSRISIRLIAVLIQTVVCLHCIATCHGSFTCGSAAGTNSACGAGADSTADARSDRAAGASAEVVAMLSFHSVILPAA